MDERLSFDELWMGMCDLLGKRSPCLSRKAGVVIVRNNILLSTGYNGPPRGIIHCDERTYEDKNVEEQTRQGVCPRKAMGFKSGEGIEHCPAEHAERNAIINAKQDLEGAVLYLNQDAICVECAKAIVQAGIKEIVMVGWVEYDIMTGRIIRESGIRRREV